MVNIRKAAHMLNKLSLNQLVEIPHYLLYLTDNGSEGNRTLTLELGENYTSQLTRTKYENFTKNMSPFKRKGLII